MAYRSTYTFHKALLEKNPQLLERSPNYELPLRRTDRRYRRRCTTCCRFIASEVKGSYCSPCNSARRRNARIMQKTKARDALRGQPDRATRALLAILLS